METNKNAETAVFSLLLVWKNFRQLIIETKLLNKSVNMN